MHILVISILLFTYSAHALKQQKVSYMEYFDLINSIQYTLKPGETVSEALEAAGYKNLYEHYGAINQTLWKNGLNKDDLSMLKAGQKILLPFDPKIAKAYNSKKSPQRKNSSQRNIASVMVPEKRLDTDPWEMFLSLGYGLKFYSISQDGALMNNEVGELVPHFFELKSGLRKEDFSVWVEISNNEFRLETEQGELNQPLSGYDLGLAYKGLFIEGSVEQTPLFLNQGGEVSALKLTTIHARIGYQKTWELSSKRKTELVLRGHVGTPLSSSLSYSGESKITDYKGPEYGGELKVYRELSNYNNKRLGYYFKQTAHYRDAEMDLKGDAVSGGIGIKTFDASATIGIDYRF